MSSLHGRSLLLDVPRACIAALLFLALAGCVTSNVTPTAGVAPFDATDTVRNTDFSPRFPLANEGDSGRTRGSTQPFIFPGSDTEQQPQRDRDPEMRSASLQPAAFLKGDGVEMNSTAPMCRRSQRPFSAIFFNSISSSIRVSRVM